MRSARTLGILSIALILMLGSIRAMTFVAPATHPLRLLGPVFAGHPAALADRAMAQIGTAAGRGQPVPPSARLAMAELARRAPLSDDPFLVEGTIAQMAGDGRRAERLFAAARARDPRSQGARYFLAERYLKTGRVLPGLVEMGVLARLSETASQSLVPALAAYARSPGAIADLRRYFALSPTVRDSTLALLAGDARNAPLVLALAPPPRPGTVPPEWQGRLVDALVKSGDYGVADAMWSRLTGVGNRGLLYNPQFRKLPAPPPFNWRYSSGSAGVAEPAAGGGLDIVYYGRDEATLAMILLRLPAGAYRLAMRIEGEPRTDGMTWVVLCLPASVPLFQFPLAATGKKLVAGSFRVPVTGCAAQSLELRGRPADSPVTAEVSLRDLALTAQAPRP